MNMKSLQLIALFAASVVYCSVATASNRFVTIDTVHSAGDRMIITSLTPMLGNPEDERVMGFRGMHLSYDKDGARLQPFSVNLDFNGMRKEDFEEFLRIRDANDIAGLFDNGLFRVTKFLDIDDDRDIQPNVTLQGLESYSYGEINKTILSLGVGLDSELSTVIITDDPVPVLVPAIVGIVALTVTHYLSCDSHSKTKIRIFPKLWGGIEIQSECG